MHREKLTVKEYAIKRKVCESTVRMWIHRKRIDFVRRKNGPMLVYPDSYKPGKIGRPRKLIK